MYSLGHKEAVVENGEVFQVMKLQDNNHVA